MYIYQVSNQFKFNSYEECSLFVDRCSNDDQLQQGRSKRFN